MRRKLVEFRDALLLMRDCVFHLKSGKIYYLPALAGQLRGLLTDRDSRAEPRLLQIAEALQVAVPIYAMAGVDNPTFPSSIDPIIHFSGFPISTQKKFSKPVLITVDELLQHKVLRYKDTNYKVRTLIEWFANKLGGSHYSKSIPGALAELLPIQLFGQPALISIFVQIAESIIDIGHRILGHFSDQEIFFTVDASEFSGRGNRVLLDAKHPEVPMRTTMFVRDDRWLCFFLSGLGAEIAHIECDEPLQWGNGVKNVHLSLNISLSLTTQYTVSIDGRRAVSGSLDLPILNTANWYDWDVFYNKAHEITTASQGLYMGAFVVIGREIGDLDRAKMLIHLTDNSKDPRGGIVHFEPEAFGRSAPGQTDIKMKGAVQHMTNSAYFERIANAERR